jgi:hypothetical protein
LNLANGADLIAGVAGNANVVATFEGELDVADLEDLGASFLGILASCLEDLIDEGVCDVEDRLWIDGLANEVTFDACEHVQQS